MLFEEESRIDEAGDDYSDDSDLTFDFEASYTNLNDEIGAKMTYEEKVSMVTVDEKLSGGSVEVARGRRMTLLRVGSKNSVRRRSILQECKRRQSRLANRHFHVEEKEVPGRIRYSILSFTSKDVIIRGTSAEF